MAPPVGKIDAATAKGRVRAARAARTSTELDQLLANVPALADQELVGRHVWPKADGIPALTQATVDALRQLNYVVTPVEDPPGAFYVSWDV